MASLDFSALTGSMAPAAASPPLGADTLAKIEQARAELGSVKVPTEYDAVLKDQCVFSFDTPLSPTGLFVNLGTFQGFGEHFLAHDHARTQQRLYIHIQHTRVPIKREADADTDDEPEAKRMKEAESQVTKMAIGTDGGFAADAEAAKFELRKTYALVFVDGGEPRWRLTYAHDDSASGAAAGADGVAVTAAALPDQLARAMTGIIRHAGRQRQQETAAWEEAEEFKESKYAADLAQEASPRRISPHSKDWKCDESGETENLWLNLSDGFIGSGRRHWDGSGGNGAAERHYKAMLEQGKNYPLVVKLGTITPDGGDVFSYAADENDMVLDSKLGEHLAHFGINIMGMKKTAKTMAELTIDLNKSYDWSKILEDGSKLVPLRGPGYVGLRNLGNSCYMASVMQVLCALPEAGRALNAHRDAIYATAPAAAHEDLLTQLCKLADALRGKRYAATPEQVAAAAAADTAVAAAAASHGDGGGDDDADAGGGGGEEEEEAQTVFDVEPHMFKVCAANGNADWLGGEQQDAEEYLRHVLEQLGRAETAAAERLAPVAPGWTGFAKRFAYGLEERLQCTTSSKVRYRVTDGGSAQAPTTLGLQVPMDAATNAAEVAAYRDQEAAWRGADGGANKDKTSKEMAQAIGDPVRPNVPFQACLDRFFAPSELQDWLSPATGVRGSATQTARIASFPAFLVVQIKRYYVDENWTAQKLDVQVDVPEELDLERYRAGGLQEGEEPLPEDATNDGGAAAAVGGDAPEAPAAPQEPDPTIVATLVSMGFGENGCKRAALAVGNSGVEAASEWVFAHMGDDDFNDPLPPAGADAPNGDSGAGSGGADAEKVENLIAMTCLPRDHVEFALGQCANDMERAADWLFSRDEVQREAAIQAAAGAGGGAGGTAAASGAATEADDGVGAYELVGFISHLGKNTGSGHYVCHIKKNGKWAFFNDSKVAQSERPPKDEAYLYIFQRKDYVCAEQ